MRSIAATLVVLALASGPVNGAGVACRHLDVRDSTTGTALRGIEDMVVDGPRQRLVLSAHDREAEGEPDARPANGIYALSLAQVRGADVARADLLAGSIDGLAMRPHGIDLRQRPDGGADLLAVNHRFYRVAVDGAGRPGTTVERFDIDATGALRHRTTVAAPDLCPANDIAWAGPDTAMVTLDRTACGGWRRSLELALSRAGGSLARVDLATGQLRHASGQLYFPNGVTALAGDIFVALTRADRIERHHGADRQPTGGWAMPGGPDNMSVDSSGRLIVAVHPSLFAYALYMSPLAFWADAAPTRIVRLDPRRAGPDACEILLDDPDGRHISGASSAVVVASTLVAGAAFDAGLMVCDLPGKGVPCGP